MWRHKVISILCPDACSCVTEVQQGFDGVHVATTHPQHAPDKHTDSILVFNGVTKQTRQLMQTAVVNGRCKGWTVVLVNCNLTDRNLIANVDVTLRLRQAESLAPYLPLLAGN